MNQHLLPSFVQKFDGVIWRIKTDATRQVIAIETRDAASHSVFFSAFNYVTGHRFFKDITVDDSWWLSLDEVYSGTVYLHGFSGGNTPERKSILAIDLSSGNKRWEIHHLALEAITPEGPVVYNTMIRPRRLQLVSAETGMPLKSNIQKYETIHQEIHYPIAGDDPSPVERWGRSPVAGPVWHLEYMGRSCYSFHLQTGETFTQHLLISSDGNVLLEDYLATGIQKLNPEAFFILQGRLFCIRNKNEIVSYLL